MMIQNALAPRKIGLKIFSLIYQGGVTMKAPAQVFILFSFVVFTVFVLRGVFQTENEENQCIMSWMRPKYVEVENMKDENYKLLYYTTGKNRKKYGGGIPVLFLHGNVGKYKQVRSIGQYAAVHDTPNIIDPAIRAIRERNDYKKFGRYLDFYTINFESEFSAFSSSILNRQVDYVDRALNTFYDIYGRDTPVMVLAHSMGGLLIKSLLKQHPNVKVVFHLSSPLIKHPISLNYELWRFYHNFHNIENDVEAEAIEVSISGGFRDIMINYDQTLLYDQTYITTEISGVGISSDHQAIVWCGQVVQTLSNVLIEIANLHPVRNSFPSKNEIISIVGSNFKSKFMEVVQSERPVKVDILPDYRFQKEVKSYDIEKLNVKEYPSFFKLDTKNDKIYELENSIYLNERKKKKAKIAEDVFFMTTLRKNTDFEVYGTKKIEKENGEVDITYYNLNDYIEVLPYYQKMEKHREKKEYPKRTPKSLFFFESFIGTSRNNFIYGFDSFLIRFKKEEVDEEFVDGVGKSPQEFIIGVDRHKSRTHLDKEFSLSERLSLFFPRSTTIPIPGQTSSIVALSLSGLDMSLPYEVEVKYSKKKSSCFDPVVVYWLKNEEIPSQHRILNLEGRFRYTFELKFFPDDEPFSEKNIEMLIFTDPSCVASGRVVEEVKIKVSWPNVFYYAIKFEIDDFVKVIFASTMFSLIRLVNSSTKKGDSKKHRRSKSHYFVLMFLDNFWVMNIVMISLRSLSKYVLGSKSSFVYTLMMVMFSLATIFCVLLLFTTIKLLLNKSRRLTGIIMSMKRNVLIFVLLMMIFFPSTMYILFFVLSVLCNLVFDKNSSYINNQFYEGLALVYFFMGIFNVFPIVASYTTQNLSRDYFQMFFELPFFLVMMHGSAEKIQKMFQWNDKLEFMINALAFMCLLVEEKLFMIYMIAQAFFVLMFALSIGGGGLDENKTKKKK